MLKAFFILLLLTLSLAAESQSDKRDYVWLFSNNTLADEGKEAYLFDFNDNGNVVQSFQNGTPLEFSGNNASICDREGNLLYYTNGCHIAGADHQILPNGSGLNPGPFITEFLMDTCSDYRSIQEVLFLEDPRVSENHYLLHKTICLLYTSPSPRDATLSRMPSSA